MIQKRRPKIKITHSFINTHMMYYTMQLLLNSNKYSLYSMIIFGKDKVNSPDLSDRPFTDSFKNKNKTFCSVDGFLCVFSDYAT